MPPHFELFDQIEAFGARVVLDGTLTGERGLPPPFDRERLACDPLSALVAAYFEGIPDIFRRPNTPCFAWLRQRLAERGAQGIILWHYAWCDLWLAEVSRFKEELGLPLLHLDAGDAAELNPQMLKRVQAFVEMLAA
jgi:benzoyl-CoA reductase/2-hydroxyglutaryl-CoA dehydratase subunit BcrC/BadD/HgdB